METAALIAGERARSPQMELVPSWRDAYHGSWEGRTIHEVMRNHAAETSARFADPWRIAPPGGETLLEVQRRVRSAWQELLRHHDGGRVAVVTQATPIQLVLCDLLGIEPAGYWHLRIDPGSLTCIDLYPTAAIARTINEVLPLRNRTG